MKNSQRNNTKNLNNKTYTFRYVAMHVFVLQKSEQEIPLQALRTSLLYLESSQDDIFQQATT